MNIFISIHKLKLKFTHYSFYNLGYRQAYDYFFSSGRLSVSGFVSSLQAMSHDPCQQKCHQQA